ncbi:uncharacterized protein LOC108107182 [Drosophila eugracilis]|uniref:uncharacterized protein LOC108107182 n=1 Tax=Drosophila eugracilis TaxID=29029 RepID=UPI001BDA747B|nr:uncharacterized protein LOC108107182 [Drosophila eugracilis]
MNEKSRKEHNIPEELLLSKNPVLRTEFKLYNIMPGHGFQTLLLKFCHGRRITGFIVYFDRARRAFGVMEGKRKCLIMVKEWLLASCIPEPFVRRVHFSSLELSLNSDRALFHEKRAVPKNENFLGDMYEKCFEKSEFDGKPKEETKESLKLLGEYADFYDPALWIDSDFTIESENLDSETTTPDDDSS